MRRASAMDLARMSWYCAVLMRRASVGWLMKPPSMSTAGCLMPLRTLKRARRMPRSGRLVRMIMVLWMAVARAMLLVSWAFPGMER